MKTTVVALLLTLPVIVGARERSPRQAYCYRCHVQHVSEIDARVTMPTIRTCLSCHDGVIAGPFRLDSLGHIEIPDNAEVSSSTEAASCTRCHDPHKWHRALS